MLTRLGGRLRMRASARCPHTNAVGLARTLLALGTLGTFVFSDTLDLFRPAVGMATSPHCSGIARGGLFCLAGKGHLGAAHFAAVVALLVVASGWRPRITGLIHWYVSASLFSSALMVDGGDQVTVVLTLLLVPVTLTDSRRWHWQAPPASKMLPGTHLLPTGAAAARLVALSCLTLIRLQMAGIYFQAATSKMRVPEWRDGTAVYYWFTDPWFGLSEPLRSWSLPLLATSVGVTTATWGAIMLEIFLFAGLIAEPRYRKVLLYLGFAFHAAIGMIHGLLSFSLAMWGGLLLYLHPVDQEFDALRTWGGRLVKAVRVYLRLYTPALRPLR